MIQRTEGHFNGHDRTELFYQTWLQNNPKGTLVVTHGLSEHSECYNLFANGISQANWDVYAWDLRGHGRSEGKRGLVLRFSEYCEDLNLFLKLVRENRNSKNGPLVLVGHSMGGLVSARTLLDFPESGVNGLCLSSPAFGISLPVPKIKDKASGFLGKWFPQLTLNNEIKYERLTHDKKVLAEYPNDPLRHDKISPRLYLGMLENFSYVLENAHQITIPVLLQAAGQDLLVSLAKEEEFFAKLPSEAKLLKIYQESYHEIYNDIERETVFSDLMAFLQRIESGF